MSEAVQQHMENMLKEFEQLEATHLFSKDEMGKLRKRRRELEIRVCGPHKTLEDFDNYIKHETKLLKTLRTKLDRPQNNLLSTIGKRIKRLYEIAIQQFPYNASFFNSCLEFYRNINHIVRGTHIVQSVTQRYPNDVSVWQNGAKWYSITCKNNNMARCMLLKGLATNSDSIDLYKQLILLELTIVPKSEANDDNTKRLKEVIEETFKHINNCSFYIDVLEMLKPYLFTATIQETIRNHLLEKYSNKEVVWDVLAHARFNCSSDKNLTGRLEACYGVYREGLAAIDPANKNKLWTLFLKCLIENSLELHSASNYVESELLKALAEADKENALKEKDFLVWLRLLDDKIPMKIVERAVSQFPKSVDIWTIRLHTVIKIEMEKAQADTISPLPPLVHSEKVKTTFKLAVLGLKERALPIWLTFIKYCIATNCSNEMIESIFWDGAQQPEPIASVMKVQYIEWLSTTSADIHKVRQNYFKIAEFTPHCLQLHIAMSNIESMQLFPDYTEWEKVHQLACEQLGDSSTEVWLNHIDFYLTRKQGRIRKGRIDELQKKAVEKLNTSLASKFLADFYALRDSVLGKKK